MKYVTWNYAVNIGLGQMHKLVLNYTKYFDCFKYEFLIAGFYEFLHNFIRRRLVHEEWGWLSEILIVASHHIHIKMLWNSVNPHSCP